MKGAKTTILPRWSENIKKLRVARGYNQTELSALSEVSAALISQLESGSKNFTQKTLELLAEALGCSIYDFFSNDPENAVVAAEKQRSFNAEFTIVPKYKARLSGGHGSLDTSDQVESYVVFRTEFLESRVNGNSAALFSVSGDSMEPFIYDDDVVLVDLSTNDPKEIIDGKAYAYREDDAVKVKRLARQGGKLIAKSENNSYPPYTVDTENFTLFGRVIWVGHEVV